MRTLDKFELTIAETGNIPTVEEQLELFTTLLPLINLVEEQLKHCKETRPLHWKAIIRAYGNSLMDINVSLVEPKKFPGLYRILGEYKTTLDSDPRDIVDSRCLAVECVDSLIRQAR